MFVDMDGLPRQLSSISVVGGKETTDQESSADEVFIATEHKIQVRGT
jgi:hypothetical protein